MVNVNIVERKRKEKYEQDKKKTYIFQEVPDKFWTSAEDVLDICWRSEYVGKEAAEMTPRLTREPQDLT